MKSEKRAWNAILYRTVGILLMVTLLTAWLVCGLFAKYTTSGAESNSARVAGSGVVKFELWEHAVGEDGKLTDKKTAQNTYKNVEANTTIQKDPFIELELKNAEVDYELYIRVTESAGFPNGVTYDLTAKWEKVDGQSGVYKYTGYFDAGTPYDEKIEILKDNKLTVDVGYDGKTFSLTFEAWLVQVD